MFSKNTIKKSVGVICALIGISLYIIGYGFMDIQSTASKIIINIADVFIIGVVVGYLSSVAQWAGVFKKEIQDIVFGKKLIGERNDINSIWSNVTKQLLKNKFAPIHEELLCAIRNAAIPSDDTVSYYEDHDSDIQLSWYDKAKGLIKSTESITFTLMAESDKEIKLPIKTFTYYKKDSPGKVSDPNILVDGKRPTIKHNPPQRQGNQTINSSTVLLKGKKQYLVSYTREKVYDINQDYYIGLKSQYLVRNLTVSLHLPDDIEALFIERGTNLSFITVKKTKNCIKMKLKGVIFPKQGYIFALKVA
ncbi:MAG TPA: hypothetical protein DCR26_02515 [Porphyromonadaceae bacterium]|nr:hypothetical protein [Porphyromonadaceae bacterium]